MAKPPTIPAMAPSRFMRLEKMPMTMAGKKEAAAKPKARATTEATKPGGWIPKYPATITAKREENRAIQSSFLSEMAGANCFLIRSWEIEVEITNRSPAAVDRAAARPPAATRAITQLGRLAISGLARTMMS